MKCIVCNTKMGFYFSKEFKYLQLRKVDYFLCQKCNFVASKTHFEMDDKEWEILNTIFHQNNNKREDNPYHRSERYFNQGLMLYLMKNAEFFQLEPYLDWGSGVGSLSKRSKLLFNIDIVNYDKYITPSYKKINAHKLKDKKFSLVIADAVFEHIADRKTLDEINSYVSPNGCLAIHTMVREKIPKDPEWMYLLPVHCSFFANKTMQIIMDQWGYKCSVYNEHSKMWIFFKNKGHIIEKKVKELNEIIGWNYLKFKSGFMDYWK